jgi:hypothetical protein
MLNPAILGDRLIQIYDPTNSLLSFLEELGQHVRGEAEAEYLPAEHNILFVVPRELEESLYITTRELFPAASAVPLDRGVEAAISFLIMASRMPENPTKTEERFLFSVVNLIKATWLLQCVKASRDYDIVAQFYLQNPVEEQLRCWGMTVKGILERLEAVSYLFIDCSTKALRSAC